MLHKYYEPNAAGSEGELILMVIVRPEYRMIEGSLNSKLPTVWRVEKQMKST